MLCGLLLELHLRVAIAAHDCRGHVSLLLLAAPEEGHDLRSGAIRVGAECGVGGSLGDVLLDRPQYRISISSSRHIK